VIVSVLDFLVRAQFRSFWALKCAFELDFCLGNCPNPLDCLIRCLRDGRTHVLVILGVLPTFQLELFNQN